MTVIDTHQHFWNYNPQRDGWITNDMSVLRRNFLPLDAKTEMDAAGVRQCVAVQADQSMDETKFLLSLADKHDFISGVVGWVDLGSDNLDETLSALKDQPKLKGFRHILQSDPTLMRDDHFINGVSSLGNYNFTYDLLIYYHQLDAAFSFVDEVSSSTPVVVDHIAKPSIKTGEFDVWAKGMKALAQVDNVYCKVSGMITEADWYSWKADDITRYLDVAFELFGTSRLMYGSDWPVCLLAGSYTRQWKVVTNYISKLSENEKTLVLGDNAKRFYKL